MSAVNTYRYELSRIGKEMQPKHWNEGARTIAEFADAALAELEVGLKDAEGALAMAEIGLHAFEPRLVLLEAELVELRERRCANCKSWDYELAETVAGVSFAFCENSMAYKEFKNRVVSEGWLCPCWEKRSVA